MSLPIITVNSRDEIEETLRNNNHKISSSVVNTIFRNLKNKKKTIPILEMRISEENSVYNIFLKRDDLLSSLEKNLKIHEHYEEYEMCSKIIEAIEYLKKT